MRPRLQNLRALPTSSAAPRRRCHLANATRAPTHQNPLSPLSRVEPKKYSLSVYPYCVSSSAGIAFIGISGEPPATGPVTVGTATAETGRTRASVDDDDDADDDRGDDDEHPATATALTEKHAGELAHAVLRQPVTRPSPRACTLQLDSPGFPILLKRVSFA